MPWAMSQAKCDASAPCPTIDKGTFLATANQRRSEQGIYCFIVAGITAAFWPMCKVPALRRKPESG